MSREPLRQPAVDWAADIPCAGLHEMFTSETHHEEALRLCAPCQHKRACRELVQPQKSTFSGVCAGWSWRNGRPLKKGPWR